jgi:hypothetical protein
MGVRLFVYSSFLEDAHSLFVTLLTLLSVLIFVKGDSRDGCKWELRVAISSVAGIAGSMRRKASKIRGLQSGQRKLD